MGEYILLGQFPSSSIKNLILNYDGNDYLIEVDLTMIHVKFDRPINTSVKSKPDHYWVVSKKHCQSTIETYLNATLV